MMNRKRNPMISVSATDEMSESRTPFTSFTEQPLRPEHLVTEAQRSNEPVLTAHSLAEVHLYVMVQICRECGEGPLRATMSQTETTGTGSRLTLQTRCAHCQDEGALRFVYPSESSGAAAGNLSRLNPTGDRSQILDVAQWVTLHRIMLEAANRATEKAEAWELRCDAGECIDEALRFFEPESDLPPASAFLTSRSRRRLKDRPELYIRQSLLDARRKLPARRAEGGKLRSIHSEQTRPWWQFWRTQA